MHVARPLGRAHAHHVPLRARVPAAAALVRELLADAVPDLLGVDRARRRGRRRPPRHSADVPPVEVDERTLPGPVLERAAPRRRRSRGRRRRAGRSCRRRSSRPRPRAAAARRSRTAIPSHCTSGGTLRAKCCARCVLVAGEDRDAPLAPPRRAPRRATPTARERDRDERRRRARARRATRPSARPSARPPRRRRPTRPAGQRRKSARCSASPATDHAPNRSREASTSSSARSAARVELRSGASTDSVRPAEGVVQARDREVALRVGRLVVRRRARGPSTSRRG